MPKDDRGASLERALRAFQENVRRAGPAAAASYGLIGAIMLFGALGYAADRWRGTSPRFLLTGLVLGITIGFLQLARAVWKK